MSENAFIVPHTSLIIWLGIEFRDEIIFFRNIDALSHFALTAQLAEESCVSFLVSELCRGSMCNGYGYRLQNWAARLLTLAL